MARYIILLSSFFFLTAGCMPFDKIVSHDFADGYFKLKNKTDGSENVYLNLSSDSIIVYPVIRKDRFSIKEPGTYRVININNIEPDNFFYNSTFIKTFADIDLSTIILKYRPSMADVPPQLNANANGILYAGYRKDFFKIKSHPAQLHNKNAILRHTGFDFGLFAGIGISPVNSTVTSNFTSQEYDGIVFQKGASVFFTFENMSVGLALGFDNLLDKNKSAWIYNQKPWLGIVLGIANF